MTPYRAILKQPLTIINEMTLPIPVSHSMPSRKEVLEWLFLRGIQGECLVIPEPVFRARGGR